MKVYKYMPNYSKFTLVSEKISFKIFNQIYGQHNRNWQNVIKFFVKVKFWSWKLFKILYDNLDIKSYCEFNAPFMGRNDRFFNKEYNQNSSFYKIFLIILELSSRQVAGKKTN